MHLKCSAPLEAVFFSARALTVTRTTSTSTVITPSTKYEPYSQSVSQLFKQTRLLASSAPLEAAPFSFTFTTTNDMICTVTRTTTTSISITTSTSNVITTTTTMHAATATSTTITPPSPPTTTAITTRTTSTAATISTTANVCEIYLTCM